MSKPVRFILLAIGLLGVLAIRQFEQHLFYDPLIEFFRSEHLQQSVLPELEIGRYLAHITLRYLLNMLCSLLAIWALFQNREYLKLSGLLFGFLFVLLLPALYWFLTHSGEGSFMALFYIRRFLMQPLLVLLLIPAFYFQKKA